MSVVLSRGTTHDEVSKHGALRPQKPVWCERSRLFIAYRLGCRALMEREAGRGWGGRGGVGGGGDETREEAKVGGEGGRRLIG